MQVWLALLGLLALATVAEVEGQRAQQCTDGSVWYQECNRCWCIQGRAACTLKGCAKSLGPRSRPQCEDGSRWMQDGCNWCNCINGIGVCTKRACLPKWATAASSPVATFVARTAPAPSDSAEPECEATGGRWRVGCNWCRCSETGRGLCTKRACHPREYQRGERKGRWMGWWEGCAPKGPVMLVSISVGRGREDGWDVIVEKLQDTPMCEEGARWRIDCNWCSCEDGSPVCTALACPSEQTSSQDEAAGGGRGRGKSVGKTRSGYAGGTQDRISCEAATMADRWRQDCNWCRCIDGLSACTKRGCPPSLRARLASTPECEGTVRWKKNNCNWCTCHDGRAACTLKACIDRDDFLQEPEEPQGQVYEPDCVAPSSWTENCNQCQCVDGVKICTLKACVTEEEDTCEEGSVWKRDCNWCSCKDNKPACSKRACRPVSVPEDPSVETCVEGTSWQDDCNTCSCSNGHAICTLMACVGVVRPAVIPDPSKPQVEQKPRDGSRPAVIPDPSSPQVERQRRTAVSLPTDDRDCVPGSRFSMDGCNWCTCTSTGRAACTLKLCFKRMDTVCEEGARWKQDCNWCSCAGGQAQCTEMACFDAVLRNPIAAAPAVEDASITGTSADVVCKADSHWTHACSTCSCDADGQVQCETTSCPEGVDPALAEDTCSEGAEWKQSCLVCRCGDDGKPLCSSSACSDSTGHDGGASVSTSESLQCRPGSTFREECNNCRCSSTGRKLCTKKRCRPGLTSHSGPECSEGSLFLDRNNCNWCFCDEGKIVCSHSDTCAESAQSAQSEAAAPAGVSDADQESGEEQCDEGTTWMQECNRCRCINGVALCDRRACVTFTEQDSQSASVQVSETDSTNRRCLKPVDSGPCFASFRRFRFNPDNNRCEGFLYGGCAGNDNNFKSAEDCQQTCGGDAPVLDAECDRRQCPNYREVAYMRVRGCTPEYENANCCPTGFTCADSPASDPDSCTYNSTSYAMGDNVPVENPCSRCRCSNGPSGAELNCISVECPSLFQRPEPNCRRLYKLDECCSYAKECEEDDASAVVTRSDTATCESQGRTYKEGDKMDFDDAPCQRCVCGANYTGPYGEGCAPIDCGYDTRSLSRIRRGCVPLFYKARCCPISYICPGDRQVHEDQSQANPDDATQGVCTFGDITVARGKELATTEAKITCTCQTPPSITCIDNPIPLPEPFIAQFV
ncbi:Pancreatic trypsin inhibitor Kunitz domain [Trinorchestia longiramus]|nr:Pancreatic trypsin inhibitor Kunitz domain [Trinorchestia longiramus]